MTPILAGLTAAIPLAILLMLYFLLRGRALAAFFHTIDGKEARISRRAMFWLVFALLIIMALGFGPVSGLVFGWFGLPVFRYLAFGIALVLSLLAIITRTPLSADKVFMNLAVGGILGILVPIFVV
jgi:hypothetical protein